MGAFVNRRDAIEAAADALLDRWAAVGRIGDQLADRSANRAEAVEWATVCVDAALRATGNEVTS